MRRSLIVCALCLAPFVACGDDGGTPAPPDAYYSECGRPGDVGNELGVGQFCAQFSDCGTTVDAPLCSSLGDPTTHFCTRVCDPGSDAGIMEQCGAGAECVCNGGGQCGCTPSECL
jgi:hypothetical protein